MKTAEATQTPLKVGAARSIPPHDLLSFAIPYTDDRASTSRRAGNVPLSVAGRCRNGLYCISCSSMGELLLRNVTVGVVYIHGPVVAS